MKFEITKPTFDDGDKSVGEFILGFTLYPLIGSTVGVFFGAAVTVVYLFLFLGLLSFLFTGQHCMPERKDEVTDLFLGFIRCFGLAGFIGTYALSSWFWFVKEEK